MKATSERKFQPVILTLETQEEVDKLFALLNHSAISDAVGFTEEYLVLKPYISDKKNLYHFNLEKMIAKITSLRKE